MDTSLSTSLKSEIRGARARRHVRRLIAASTVALLAAVAHSEFRLSEQTSEVYYRFAAVAGSLLRIEKGAEITGDLRSNGDARIKKDAVIDGDLAVVGALEENRGTVLGTVSEGVAALDLPAIDDEATLRGLADRTFDTSFLVLRDEVIDDVVFVAGSVRLLGQVGGTGTLIASGSICVGGEDDDDECEAVEDDDEGDEDDEGDDSRAPDGDLANKDKGGKGDEDDEGDDDEGDDDEGGTVVAADAQLSLIALRDIRIGQGLALRGVLRAGDDLRLDKGVTLDGVAIADDQVRIQQDVVLRFVDFDEVAPSVTFVEPADGGFVTTATPRIELAFTDDFSGVRAADTVFTLDGAERTAEAAVSAEGLVFTPAEALAEGLHGHETVIFDHSDNEGRGAFSFVVDTVAPSISITAPTASPIFNALPAITLAYADATSGVALSSLVVDVDGVDITGGCAVEAAAATCAAPSLAEGSHTITAALRDQAGNASSASFTFELVVDVEPPSLTITEPAVTPVVNEATPTIAVAYADAISGVDLSTLAIALDGDDLTAACSLGSSAASCVPPALAEGVHTVDASLSDLAGNRAAAAFSFEVIFDDEGPVITVLSPTGGDTVTEELLTVAGTVTDKSPIAGVSVNGISATVTGDGFEAVIALEPGPNAVLITASDIFGNASSASLEVILDVRTDTTPPQLTIVNPTAGVFVVAAQPNIELRFADAESGVDPTSLALTLDGQPLAVQCSFTSRNAVCIPETTLPEGDVVLSASLEDRDGNAAVAEVAFVVDTVGVEIDILEPAEGTLTRDAELLVRGTAGPDVASLRINDVAAAVSGGAFSATVPLREGTNMVVVSATKVNGNTGTASLEVTRDVTAPIVKIDAPRDGLVAVSDKVTVTGLVNDIVTGGVTPRVRVNGVEASVAGGSFMLVDLRLVPGPNVIEAVGTDAVGNEGRDAITVTFQPPVGARILLGSGNGQLAVVRNTLPQPLVAVVEDDFGNPVAGRLVRFEVVRNSGTLRASPGDPPQRVVQVATDGSGRAAVTFTLGDTAGEGNNRVRATAVGVAGEVELCATALAAPPNKVLMVEGDNQRGVVGQPLAAPLEAMVLDPDGNPVVGAPVIYTVIAGGGNLNGFPEVTRLTGIDGVARAVHTLGFAPGVSNNTVRAVTPGVAGLPATFTASALAPGDPAKTRLKGLVLDNSQTPIPNAVVRVAGGSVTAVTDADGQFVLPTVPVGRIELEIDPSGSPRAELFPPLALETVTVAGQLNEVGQPILLPTLDTTTAQIVGGEEDVTLTMEGVGGLSLTVLAGSATFPDGSKTGPMTISQVHLDKVPMQPPNGSIFMPPAWTIQPAGVIFDPPARLTIPNDGLAIGRVIDIFQFDHTLNEFIDVGKATVSEDGSVIVSDPGFGVTRSGWGGCGQPQPPPTCPSSCDDGNDCTRDFCQDGSCQHEPIFPDGCDDGKECTVNDRCQEGECKGDPVAEGTPCGGSTNDESCTFDACDDAGNCETGQPKEDGTACDDMEFCTDPDTCMGGECMGEEPEDMNCAPIDVSGDLGFGPYDVIIVEIPEVKAMLDLTLDVTKECCEEKMNRESLKSDGDGSYSGSVSGLGISVPGPGTIVKLIDKIICKKIINRIPKVECEVGINVVLDGVSIMGSLGVTDDQCAMTTQWRGSGDVTLNGLGLDGSVKVTVFGQSLGAGLSGTAEVTGNIEGAENSLLVSFNVSGVTVTGTINLPIIGDLSLDGTTPPIGAVGPFRTGAPGFTAVCQ